MPFKRKDVVTVGSRLWEVRVPNPPQRATHARLVCGDELNGNGKPKVAVVPIQDFKCFSGVCGKFQYIRMNNRRKVTEEYADIWFWDGKQVEGI
jgi:hypothetical protein